MADRRCIVLISGVHRSGTSLLTQLLSQCGGGLPRNLMPPHPDNPDGYFEANDLVAHHEQVLATLGSWWDDIRPLPADALANMRHQGGDLLALLDQHWQGQDTLLIKDPRLSRLLPLWQAACQDSDIELRHVIPVRHPLEVAASLRLRDGMMPAKAQLLWLRHFLEAERATRGQDRHFISHDHLLREGAPSVLALARKLRLPLPGPVDRLTTRLEQTIRPALRHYQHSQAELLASAELPALLRRAYAWSLLAGRDGATDNAELDAIQVELGQAAALYRQFLHEGADQQRRAPSSPAQSQQALSERLWATEVLLRLGEQERAIVTAPVLPVPPAPPIPEAAPAGPVGNPPRILVDQPFRDTRARRFPRAWRLWDAIRRTVIVAWRAGPVLLNDTRERAGGAAHRILKIQQGTTRTGRSLAIYAHFAPHGGVSEMVLAQLRHYAELGFRIIFVSAAPSLSPDDFARLSTIVETVVQRRNFGLDFGAWSDALHAAVPAESWDELLLVNDSVVGPLVPLGPLFARLRSAGHGIFGLTEGIERRPHLQSYFVLARGVAATADLSLFLRNLSLSSYKSRTIRRGELGLTSTMQSRGHSVAALWPYAELERAVAASPEEMETLAATVPRLSRLVPVLGKGAFLRRAMLDTPLNPTHHFAGLLVRSQGFPFIKAELLLSNPVRSPAALDWEALIPASAPVSVATIRDHLTRRATPLRQAPPSLSAPNLPVTAGAGTAYEAWIQQNDQLDDADRILIRQHIGGMADTPLISVLMPVYNPPAAYLQAAILSVRAQLYPHFELCIVDDASTQPHVQDILRQQAAADARIKLLRRARNGHIAVATNQALSMAQGHFVALMDHDDLLPEQALYEVAAELERHPAADIVYSDEDKIDHNGRRYDPYFKPDWDPDLILAQNFISHLGVYRRSLILDIGGIRSGLEGSQDHDLTLRAAARTTAGRIRHIPAILYHWRQAEAGGNFSLLQQDRCAAASQAAITQHLRPNGAPGATVVPNSQAPNYFNVRWPLPDQAPSVSIIVPTRDRAELLRVCARGVLEGTEYPNLRLVIADNDSREASTLALLAKLQRDPRVQVLRCPGPFNYAVINNAAVAAVPSDVIVLLNNDIEVQNPDWLHELVSQAMRPDVGAVGAKLRYGDGRIQHAGVILGMGNFGRGSGVAGHRGLGAMPGDPGPFGHYLVTREATAVTGACLALRREVFVAVGGLDEDNLAVAFNDVDLCLRIRAMGLRVVWTPGTELLHLESASRGSDEAPAQRARFLSECAYMRRRWGAQLDADPFHNPNLALSGSGYELAFPSRRRRPWAA